jgi:hypothetical protein
MPGTPMVDDIELNAVQHVRQETEQGYVTQRVAGLEGTLHQRLGRRSHRVRLAGVLVGDTAHDDLEALQKKAQAGDEVTFSADITTALEISHMVIEEFVAEQRVGPANQFAYALLLVENPPLPPPEETSAFGGLDDFGVGDLGFGDVDGVLAGVADQAGSALAAADGALEAAAGLGALAGLADFGNVDNPLTPLTDQVSSLSGIGDALSAALAPLRDLA